MADKTIMNKLADRFQRKWSLRSDKFSDVHFLVGNSDNQRIISANKLVLSMHSDVFEVMLTQCAVNPNSAGNPIRIPGVCPDAFAYLVELFKQKESALPFEILVDVMYAAKKYLLDIVIDDCEKRLQCITSMDDVFKILHSSSEYAHAIFDEAAQTVINGKFVEANKAKFLVDARFYLLPLSVVKIIGKNDTWWCSPRLKYESIKTYCIRVAFNNRGIIADSEEKHIDVSWQSVFAEHFRESFSFEKLSTAYLFGTIEHDKVLPTDELLTVLKNKCTAGFMLEEVLLTRPQRDCLHIGDRVDCRDNEGKFFESKVTNITSDTIYWTYIGFEVDDRCLLSNSDP